jgi:hypothetical protein
VTRLPAPAAAAQKRWGSTSFPATSFLDPPREVEADVQRVGQHGPLRNLDVKESTVELSTACECKFLRPAISRQPAADSRRAGNPACPRRAAECSERSQRGVTKRGRIRLQNSCGCACEGACTLSRRAARRGADAASFFRPGTRPAT